MKSCTVEIHCHFIIYFLEAALRDFNEPMVFNPHSPFSYKTRTYSEFYFIFYIFNLHALEQTVCTLFNVIFIIRSFHFISLCFVLFNQMRGYVQYHYIFFFFRFVSFLARASRRATIYFTTISQNRSHYIRKPFLSKHISWRACVVRFHFRNTFRIFFVFRCSWRFFVSCECMCYCFFFHFSFIHFRESFRFCCCVHPHHYHYPAVF